MFCKIVPNNFNDFIFHKDIINKLKNYNQNTLINILFYGPKSSGKKILIKSFIKYIYNLNELQTEIIEYDIKINNNDVQIKCIQSKYHYEFFLNEYGLYDKHVLCNFIKEEIISTKNIINNGYKIIVLHSIDKLNKNALLSLRRIMEMHTKCARFIYSANNLSKLDESILSRCLNIRVPFPKNQIDEYLDYCENKLKKSLNRIKIKSKCKDNLFKLNTLIYNNDYIDPLEIYIKNINDIIKTSNNITFIDNIRVIIYKLHLLDFSPEDILKNYLNFIIKSKDYNDIQKHKIIEECAKNEYYTKKTNKYFFALENFFIFIKNLNSF